MNFTKIALALTFILSAFAEDTKLEKLSFPLEEGDSRTYNVVHAIESRSVEGATITVEHNKITVAQGECNFGGEFTYDKTTMGFAWVDGSFFRSFGLCSGPINDVLMMVSDLIDLKKGYVIRNKVFNSEWFTLGWNAEGNSEVDLLVGQKVLPNPHSLNPQQ